MPDRSITLILAFLWLCTAPVAAQTPPVRSHVLEMAVLRTMGPLPDSARHYLDELRQPGNATNDPDHALRLAYLEAAYLNRIDNGASGYLLKSCGAEELVEAIRNVHGGGTWLSRNVIKDLVDVMHATPTTLPIASRRDHFARIGIKTDR